MPPRCASSARHLPLPPPVAKTDPCFRGSYAPTLELYREKVGEGSGGLTLQEEEHRDPSRKRAGHQRSLSTHPIPRKFFPRLGAFVDDGGWRRRRRGGGSETGRGLDLSCQTLAPRGGAPSLPRLPGAHPKVSNRDSGVLG